MAHQSYRDAPEDWRDRAAHVRALADEVDSQKAKEALLQIAAEFELLAESAQERAKPKRPAG